jgi:hypothetical protein
MEERKIRKIKTISYFISFYKTFFLITCVSTFLISFIILMLFEDDKFFIKSFLENWNKKPITEVKYESEKCSKNYEEVNLGSWPVSSDICDCSQSYLLSKSVKSYPCNIFMRLLGCKNSDEMKKININQWKGLKICVKRTENTYIESINQLQSEKHYYQTNLNNSSSEIIKNTTLNCECYYYDSQNKKLCISKTSSLCPITNSKINLYINEKSQTNKSNRSNFKRRKFRTSLKNNITTFNDLEGIYNKNFNISYNNEIIQNYAISDLMIAEHYPCLIPNIAKKNNEIYYLLEFILENLDFIKDVKINRGISGKLPTDQDMNSRGIRQKNSPPINAYERMSIGLNEANIKNRAQNIKETDYNYYNNNDIHNFSEAPSNKNFFSSIYWESRTKILNEINLNDLDRKDCYFYENTYFDRRHYVLDIMNFYQYLLMDLKEDAYRHKNMTLTYQDVSRSQLFTPTTTMFLIASPFYGWNHNICQENPVERMESILSLYDSASLNLNIVNFFKVACLIYLSIYGVFDVDFQEFFLRMPGEEEDCKGRRYQLIFDVIYYFVTIITFCLLVQVCFILKNLSQFHFLHLIRNDCLDQNSTKLMTYLYDICDEKFIYCLFQTCVNAVEFIFFTFIFKFSYDIKLTLK